MTAVMPMLRVVLWARMLVPWSGRPDRLTRDGGGPLPGVPRPRDTRVPIGFWLEGRHGNERATTRVPQCSWVERLDPYRNPGGIYNVGLGAIDKPSALNFAGGRVAAGTVPRGDADFVDILHPWRRGKGSSLKM